MTWQTVIIVQIVVSALVALFARQVSLSVKRVFFGVGALMYLVIAVSGWTYSFIATRALPPIPQIDVLLFLAIEGLFIPAAWLLQYKLVKFIGASNTVIVTLLNTFCAALLGVIFLHEKLSLLSILGGLLIFLGIVVAIQMQPDRIHRFKVSFITKFGLVVGGAFLYALGMFAEKQAINHMGVWDYAAYGWTAQALGAGLLFVLMGRKELKEMHGWVISRGVLLGFITSLAGLLYIYALSLGGLSQTVIAASGKVVIVMILAAILLNERNLIKQRILAFILAIMGLALVFA